MGGRIRLHPGQSEVYRDLFVDSPAAWRSGSGDVHRFGAVCCARGWGKSFMAGAAASTAAFELMSMDESVPNKVVYIIAPTYDQVTDIYYPMLAYDMDLSSYCIKSSRDLGRFVFPRRTELRLVSYEAVERMRGKGAYIVIWDEISSCKKGITAREAWEGIIQPCIITRWSEARARMFGAPSAGRGLVITTPKGYNFFYDMYHYAESDPLWASWHYDYTASPLIDPSEVERVRHNIDPIEFASEYLADFKESGASVFYCFDRKVHVRPDLEDFGEDEDVHACIDFNVGLQCTSFFALRGGQMQFLNEFKGHPDTETLASSIREHYGHDRRIYAYPDPSGRARKTSAPVGITDFRILESHGIQCRARAKAPPIADSVQAVNQKLLTAAGEVGMYVHPRCQGLVKSLERTVWVDRNPDSAAIDKTEGVEHYSDGVRYATEMLFPARSAGVSARRGFNF